MGTHEQVAEMKSQIANMMAGRIRQKTMAKQLGISERRIKQLVRIIRLERADELKKEPPASAIGNLLSEQDIRIRNLWSIVNDDKASLREKIFALRTLKVEQHDVAIELYQIAGVLPKDDVSGLTLIDNKGGQITQNFNVLEIVDSVLAAEENLKKKVSKKEDNDTDDAINDDTKVRR